ncbi:MULTISPECIES: DUF6283 family protein [unclassified Microbacterium]|uniref:DUF6283 family protein n=1 Tax=unclassified Microbacterium TaxID=2609290 RepID=UPI002882D623|nr:MULTISPECIES: DUF6283 family protein [unclassified Microbacterium]
MSEQIRPRKTPCATCPFRRGSSQAVWDRSEYEKLERYDGDIADQTATGVFLCHLQDGCACSGWLGHRDPAEMLAVRLAIVSGHLAPESLDYSTDVPLFSSGREAAEHGMTNYTTPGPEAVASIEKLLRLGKLRERASD